MWSSIARGLKAGVCAGVMAASVSVAGTARAERPTIELDRLVRQSDALLREATRPPMERAAPSPPSPEDLKKPVLPRLGAIARDWDGSLPVPGSNVLVTDRVRVSRSSRMLIGRARLDYGWLTPYVQAGLGLWRPDRDAIFISQQDYAAQLGAGFEVQIAARGHLAAEWDYTVIYREARDRMDYGRVLAAFAVLRAEF
jgi:hypothetical protein